MNRFPLAVYLQNQMVLFWLNDPIFATKHILMLEQPPWNKKQNKNKSIVLLSFKVDSIYTIWDPIPGPSNRDVLNMLYRRLAMNSEMCS